MELHLLTETSLPEAAALFASLAGTEFPHRALSLGEFSAQFFESDRTLVKVMVAAFQDRKLIGFAGGCVKAEGGSGYITFVLVDPVYRRTGAGTALLQRLEEELAQRGNVERYEITFFNPVNLTWVVPHTSGHDHPNAPGIDVASEAYLFFKNRGYMDTAYQNSFYLPLACFTIHPDIQERLDQLPSRGLSVCFYERSRHFGLEELFDDLGSPLWKKEILETCGRADGGCPVVIAEHQGKAVGFAGPLRVQKSGRGYFAGIGVHSGYREYGLGKALFSMLCQSLKDMGAGYMTLFTGESNPARRIYQAAGFHIVKAWADMEKKR